MGARKAGSEENRDEMRGVGVVLSREKMGLECTTDK